MAHSKDYTTYPTEMREAFLRCFDTGKEVSFAVGSPTRARSVRGMLYAYRRAVEAAVFRPELPAEEKEDLFKVLKAAGQISILAEGENVVLRLKSASTEMESLRSTLEEQV